MIKRNITYSHLLKILRESPGEGVELKPLSAERLLKLANVDIKGVGKTDPLKGRSIECQ